VILLLDANVLLSDPMCNGKVWGVLAQAPKPWKLRVLVTEVVLEETVGRYEGKVSSALAEFRKHIKAKEWRRLGLEEAGSNAELAGQSAIGQYRTHLRDSLLAAHVEVIPPADVPHMQLVRRSVTRRRPCDEKGDGYRDTLNWLTVLDMAQADQNETLAWVSADKDFWNDTDDGFHEDLLEDLESVGASERVRLEKNLWAVVFELASEFSSDAGDIAALRDELQEQTVLKYLESSLSGNVEQFHLSARAVGLPLETQDVVVRTIGHLDELTYELKGGYAEGQAVAGFTVTAQVGMTLRLPVEVAGVYPLDQIVSTSDDTALVAVSKPLVFRGVLQLGRYDNPLGVETTSIEAKPEDAGLALWRLKDRQESGEAFHKFLIAESSAMKNIGLISNLAAESSAIKNIGLISKLAAESSAIKNIGLISNLAAESSAIKNIGLISNLAAESSAISNMGAISKLIAESSAMNNIGLISKLAAESSAISNMGAISKLIAESSAMNNIGVQFLEEMRRSGTFPGVSGGAPGKGGAPSRDEEPDRDDEEDEDE
jgi:hypothetical protein